MKIQRIELYHVKMPLIYPFRTAYGDDEHIESVHVRMVSGDHEGWGEGSPLRAPCYSPEWAYGAFATARDWLAPALVGRDISSPEDLQTALSVYKGNYFAKAALDVAFWDLDVTSRGLPLWRALGGKSPVVTVGGDLGVMESIDALLHEVDRIVDAGFQRLKLKFRKGWDVPVVRAVREAHPDLVMHIDCNSSFTLADLPMFREIDALGLAMIEQPLAHDDLIDHAALQREINTPVCLDESIVSVARARQAIDIGACRYVNIKPGRVGGLTNAVAIHDLCASADVPCWVGGMLESSVGQGASMALATLPNFRYPADIFPSTRFYEPDLGRPAIALSGPSLVTAPDRPGIGYRPDPERLQRQTLHRAVVEA